MTEHSPWVEKYRPTEFKDIVLSYYYYDHEVFVPIRMLHAKLCLLIIQHNYP